MALSIPKNVSGTIPASAGLASVFPPRATPKQAAATVAANTQGSLDQYLSYLQTHMGRVAPVNPAAIGKQASQELGTEVSPLLAGLDTSQQQGQAAINGYTSQLASQLGQIGPQISQAYQTAEQQQQALDASLQAGLSGAGGAQASQLAATLAQRGQDTSVAAQAASDANGYANANYATGSASLSSLFGQGAAAGAYGSQLTGLAALSGAQATKGLESDIATQRATILADAQKQYPTLVNSLTSAAEKGQSNQIAQNKAAVAAGLGALGASIKQQSANTAAQRAADAAAYQQGTLTARTQQNGITDALRSRQITDAEAKQAQSYSTQMQRLGIEDKGLSLKLIQAQKQAASGGLTGNEWTSLTNKALKQAQIFYNGIPAHQHYNTSTHQYEPVPGTGQDFTPYPQALTQLIEMGPKTASWRQQATQILNNLYKPGEGGRPVSAKTKLAVKVAAGKTAKVVGFSG